MIKTYRIIPLVFILFLFGFTFSTVSPVFAQTVDQLIERIEKLEAAVFPVDETAASGLTQPSSPHTPVVTEPHAKVTDGPWDKSMGMRHPARPCMKNEREKGPRFGCGPDMRSPISIEGETRLVAIG